MVFASRAYLALARARDPVWTVPQVVPTRPARRKARSCGGTSWWAGAGCGAARKEMRRTSVSATARQAQDQPGLAERLGIKPGQVVQELGYDDDCDEQLRQAITAVDGVELVDDDYDEDVVDVVLMWFREDDGDLVDALVDALAPLGDGGY